MERLPGNRNRGAGHDNGPRRPPPIPEPAASESSLSLIPLGTQIKTLGSTYRISEKIGQGGMGAVYTATELSTGKKVVVKFVLKTLLDRMEPEDRKTALERFEREARVAAGVVHKNVIKTLDLGYHQDAPFIVMEHFKGDNLDAAFKRCVELDERGKPRKSVALDHNGEPILGENGTPLLDRYDGLTLLLDSSGKPLMSWEWLGPVMMQICEGLEPAHRINIMHRDIKPGNLMVTMEEGDGKIRPATEVRVLDFGLAKEIYEQNAADELSTCGQIMGTFEYMAPEQVRRAQSGTDIDHRVDIYALGVVMYRLLTGRFPFSSGIDGVLERLNQMPEPPSFHQPSIPPAVDDIILKAMAIRMEDRYPTVMELREAIAASLGCAEPQTDQRTATLADVAPALTKKSGAGKVFAALAVVATLGAGGYLAYENRDMIKQKIGIGSAKDPADRGPGPAEGQKKTYVVKVESDPPGIPIFQVLEVRREMKGRMKTVDEEVFLGNTPLNTMLPAGEHKLRARRKWRQPRDALISLPRDAFKEGDKKPTWGFRFR